MHTAIYVLKPTTVTIKGQGRSRPRSIYLHQFGSKPIEKPTGEVKLKAGIYMAISPSSLEITGAHAQAAQLLGGKDEWPDPPATALALVDGATKRRVKDFFNEIIKGGDV